jgi:hypothetical protein
MKTDTIGVQSTVWSPCGTEGMLNIKSSIGIVPVGTPKPALLTVSGFPNVSLEGCFWIYSEVQLADYGILTCFP